MVQSQRETKEPLVELLRAMVYADLYIVDCNLHTVILVSERQTVVLSVHTDAASWCTASVRVEHNTD